MTQYRVLLAYVLVVSAVALPILANPYLPLVDLPNHIARHFIVANPQSAASRYFDYQLDLTPNSAVDLLWSLTRHPLDPVRFSHFAFLVYAANLVAASMVLARAVHGRWLAWPAASGLLVYNAPFFWGFQNFVFMVPFAIYGLALWLQTERYPNWLRVAVFVPICVILFWGHLFAFGLLAVAVVGRELQRVFEAGKAWPKTFLANISLAIPFLIPTALLTYVLATAPANPAAAPSVFGTFTDRLYMLISPLGEAAGAGATLKPVGAIVLGLLLLLFYFGKRSAAPHLHVALRMKGPLIAVLLLCLLIPASINGVTLVHIRFPFVLMILFIAASRWQNLHQSTARVISVAIAAALILRGGEFYVNAADYSRDVNTLKQVLKVVPEGSRILPIRSQGNERDTRFWHIQAYAVPMAESFVPTLFQGVHFLRLKPEWTDSAHPAAMSIDQRRILDANGGLIDQNAGGDEDFWFDWQEKFTHLLLIDPPSEDWPAAKNLQRIDQHGRFTLFEILPE
ncbi:hypothetical protein SAMN04488030_1825 [Aliiroseovarius halocynthiae]|uniref:Uncharacterized protein n=1 Tax=Aliiroseovarius halocynthiae TaxID=985055 RepID=A0A545SQW8_9RHOB|nr:hypothetical protein [Aliiroseovarius halocynthiae]TQV67357.1 hypothetical protein FIL88_09000 [Aliiroseovarius halocynthiae]SMR81250.1 hypothetical protein SAMN04488030_1825 [Aliiroseovarius halocynthiae]